MTKVFRGRFDCKFDQKGRLNLPSAYRQIIPKKNLEVVVTNGQYLGQRCLDIYLLKEWEALENKIAALPSLRAEVQAYQRFYLSGGQVVPVDGQNRLLIPAALRTYANLQDDAILVGMGNKIELWPSSVWTQLHEGLAGRFDDILNAVAALEER